MIGHVYSENPACAQCLAPMVELLSDAAGRLYGCKRCRAVDLAAREPGPGRLETHGYRILPRERRKLARFGRAPRASGRRVPKWATEPRPEHTGYVVVPARCAEAYGLRDVHPVADGWTVGRWERQTPVPSTLGWYERNIDVGALSFTRTKQAWLNVFRGDGVYFWAADGAPDAAIAGAARVIGGHDRLRTAWLRLRAMTGA